MSNHLNGCQETFFLPELSADFFSLRILVGPEEDDFQVTDEGHRQHAKPLPRPVYQSPPGMGSFSLQHALLY